MAKTAMPPYDFGYYLEVNPGGDLNERLLLWERTLNPMAWHEEVLWQFYDGEDWFETLQTDTSMLEKTLIRL
jgi:hypothetical protein